MSITLAKFAGASVTGFRSQVGWNESASSVTIELVENTEAGDQYSPPQTGTPMTFTSGDFTFRGIVQRALQTSSTQGSPLYEVVLQDPRELLAGAKVVIDSFTGHVSGMPNVINAFGFFEDLLGFGGGLTNSSGMYWSAPFTSLGLDPSAPGGLDINVVAQVGILPAITYLTQNISDFGGPLQYKGYQYAVDLSGLPLPPMFYRVGGNSAVSILECVSQLCVDAGCDYFCYLEGQVIKFATVSRQQQPAIGTLANFVNSLPNVISKQIGVEASRGDTNAVLLGGNVEYLVPLENSGGTDAIWPFWGLDVNGNPIIGQGQPEVDHRVVLNAMQISDIMGSFDYEVGLAELRCAAADFDSWAAYVLRWEPDKAEVINLVSGVDWETDMEDIFPGAVFARDMVADGQVAVKALGEMNVSEKNYWMERALRVYDFVADYANNYFGRKFLVRIPFFLYWKYESETTHLVASDEPCESAFTLEGGQTLGLQYGNEDFFLDTSGKFVMYGRYNDISNIDAQKVGAGEGVFQSNGLFLRGVQDESYGVLYPSNSMYPYIVVDFPVVFGKATDPLGGIEDIAAIFGFTPEAVVTLFQERQGSFPVRISQPPYRPDAVAIPMKSNRVSYGPWGTFPPWGSTGVAGPVSWSRNEELVPWNYGSIDSMNQAAAAQLANAATNLQEAETASVEIAEMPRISLGAALVAGGPSVTDISVNMGAGGYSTSYVMQTYTQRRTGFDKAQADRLQRMGRQAQEMRMAVRQLFHRRQQMGQAMVAAKVGLVQNASRAIMQQSPHEMLMGSMTYVPTLEKYRTRCALGDPREVVANVRADDPSIYWRTAAMTLEGLLRPFSTALTQENAGDMPHFESPPSFISSTMQSSKTLNPFQEGCDVDLLASGLQGEYPGTMHRLKTAQGEIDYDNARPLGLRLPMVGVGWGYEVTGKPVPNSGDESGAINTWADTFLEDHMSKPEKWRAGPLLLNWDNWRKGWTVPTILQGTLDSALGSGGNALVSIKANGTNVGDKVRVYETLGTTSSIPSGAKVIIAFYPLENRWILVSASCS